jgi:SAM-dependent methyltransferase
MDIETWNDFLKSSSHFQRENDIWFAKTRRKVSYPDNGSDCCYQVEDSSFWFRHRNNCIVSLVEKYSKNDLFFDIGGGNGFVTKALQDANIQAVLIEPGEEGVSNAKLRYIENNVCGALEDLFPLKGKLFAIGAFDVMEHLPDHNRFVKQVSEMLGKGGLFYITVPAFNFLWSNEDRFAHHFRRYRLKEVNKLLEKSNFEILYSTYFFSILLLPVLVLRTLPSKLGFRKKTPNTYREHKNRKGLGGGLLKMVFHWELNRVNKGRFIPFGTSCLVVGKKK